MEKMKKQTWKVLIISAAVLFMILIIGMLFQNINSQTAAAAISQLSGVVSTVSISADGLMEADADSLQILADKAAQEDDTETWINDFCVTNGISGIALTDTQRNVCRAKSGTNIPLEQLDFSGEAYGLSMSASYLNEQNEWAYALSCPVTKNGKHTAELIVEYEWKHIYKCMPSVLYENDSSVMMLDSLSGAVVAQSDESRETNGVLYDVQDFLQAIQMNAEEQQLVTEALEENSALLLQYAVQKEERFVYMWPIGGGTTYLIGMVPFESIIREIPVVKQSVLVSVGMILFCFILIGLFLALFEHKEQKEQKRLNEEREEYNQQLQKALERAKHADAAKTVFLSNMSHDMRTPLNGILGLLKIEEAHPNDIQLVRQDREKMKSSAEYLLSLVNDLLQMSKLENDDIKLNREAIDIRPLSKDILSIIGTRAAEKSITMLYEQQENELHMPYIYTSPLHIRQLFLNIYGNCIKYNRTGGSITTRFSCMEQNETTVVYQWVITDTGIGMSEEFLQRIYEPFSQENTDARSIMRGVGLGMSIVKKIVDAMGGSIEIHSIQGEGTSFCITIPFETAQAKDIYQEEHIEQNSIQGCRVLMAEDNALNAEIAEVLLKERGASVMTVTDGKQAFEAFQNASSGTYDVILMDMMMPVMDGVSAAKAIRALDREDAAGIPIIAMTANAFEDDKKRCLEAGMNAYLSKPIHIEKLTELIARYYKNKP